MGGTVRPVGAAAVFSDGEAGKGTFVPALQKQLTKYLTDAHSIERQALAQMRAAPSLAGDPRIAEAFAAHCRETERHERLVCDRVEERDARPSMLKDVLGILTGKGFVAFARAQPDTTGKLVAHAFSYEHMERAAYDMIEWVAERADDERTAATAREIAAEEDAMAERLRGCFDAAVAISLRETKGSDLAGKLADYLADAHAIEAQSLRLLGRARKLAGHAALADAYARHREETERVATRILAEEADAARQVHSRFGAALEASLPHRGGVRAAA